MALDLEVTPKALSKILEYAIKQDSPVFIEGKPGIGKSSIVKQVCQKFDINLIDLRLLHFETVDLRGLPSVSDGTTKWNRPDWFPVNVPLGKKTLIFLDEINAAPETIQAAAYQIIGDKRIGEHILPEGTLVWAAGNSIDDHAVVYQTPSPLRSRWTRIKVKADPLEWQDWAMDNLIDSRIIAYLHEKPNYLTDFDRIEEPSFATPRGWEILSKYLTNGIADSSNSESIDLFLHIAAGTVGENIGGDFVTYCKYFHGIPRVEDVLEGKIEFIPIDKPSLFYGFCTSIAMRAHSSYNINNKNKWIKPIFKYANSIPDSAADIAAMIGYKAFKINGKAVLSQIQKITDKDNPIRIWMDKYQGLFIFDEDENTITKT